ncbi:MlaA family lipoprotein [Paraburkholderia caballeronis]|uniref:MlaA family lipoprotein n=1 Tax=Paraburkholderia caballeronis TaxID=416943 RepID=UPI0010649957|nr:VacJ family lipoprotein [Paraburkholderia caballeronis]TDV09262.1 phospholipid-binding lipoprotein MlaA [Paraburkholderia caballeronis]TDV12322.1 phospholipid-binding lipoprotein MlaA [Paraburkholderia caballeronis]TDV22795.1 phospholipid-binding lipoprotein MlaA [Paraburkholderia caballeronis]
MQRNPVQRASIRRPFAAVAAALASLLALAGCASAPEHHAGDPFEPMNRAVFSFNEGLDQHVAKPVATGYTKITPQPLREAISNVFSNLGDVGNFANDLLQLKVTDATEDLMRVAFNTTFGLGGLIDWASAAGLPKHQQDFGLTLGHYGVPAGPYLVLPLFGPSSVRDASGWVVSSAASPTTYLTASASVPIYGANVVSSRADMLGATNLLEQAALDKYSFVRDAYTQRRAYLIDGGSKLPAYGDDDDNDNDDAASANAAAPGDAAPRVEGAIASAPAEARDGPGQPAVAVRR